ncbi:MAG TPA: Na+/H+ antiporter subunit D [Pseudogracilibacillus sp.]|nr:Na+/H+ antiporter subunit D [Pseudogracilibacillus sp.]
MSNLAVMPIVFPLFAGIILVFLNRKTNIVRQLSRVFAFANLSIVIYTTYLVFTEGTIILETGTWVAPYGIIFVADPLAILIVLATSIIAMVIALIAPRLVPERKEKYFFYAFFFFLISGVSGAFLTGDLFNLFVFFEVLLMASYGLIVLGGNKRQLRESFKYLLFNLFSSVVFVTTVSFLYAVVGTVNMAHIAQRVHEVNEQGILTVIGIVLFFVFATKAALFPLYFWMPKSYVVPNPIVSALFGALLTKVGIYAIIRIYTLIFVVEVDMVHSFFLVLAILTIIFGVIGALSTNDIKLLIAYNVIPSIGFVLLGLGLFNESGLSGSVYYLFHDMIIKAALFLLIGVVVYAAGTSDLRKMGGLIHYYPTLGWMVFLSAFILAGIPPFSGFIGKLLLLRGAAENGEMLIIIISLLMSLLILYSVMKIFIRGFWGEKDESFTPKSLKGMLGPISILLAISVFLGIGAEFVYPYINNVATYLLDPEQYIHTVLKE